jgi:4'-phosphopantetheinyl transferase
MESMLPDVLSQGSDTRPRIDVWFIPVTKQAFPVAYRLLDAYERSRIGRFRFEADRLRYAVSHGALRLILASEGCRPPELLRFRSTASGKPELADCSLEFSLSHSGDWTCVAVSRTCDVGIDVERVQSILEMRSLFERYASTQEKACAPQWGTANAAESFFAWWTRKEAMLKGLG